MAARRRYPHRERMQGKGRMRQFSAYINKTLKFGDMTRRIVKDTRRKPHYKGFVCFLLIVVMLLKRHRSFNAFEDLLDDPPMKKLFHGYDLPGCTQTIKNAGKKMVLESLEELHQVILKTAAKNKVFNKTPMHGVRSFAFDGVEPFSSRKRSCNGCQTRTFDTADGEVTEYYHRFVFIQSIGPNPHLILGFQPQLSVAQRKAKDSQATKAEGELTAVKPLVERLRRIFPRMFDIGVGDALYANGPMFAFMRQGDISMDMIAVLKKENDQPMVDAIGVFETMEPTTTYYDHKRGEHVRMWDSEGFMALATCPYPLRVIKALIHEGPKNLDPRKIDWEGENVHTWWMATGRPQTTLSGRKVFDILRHRWQEENCAFNELTQHWNFKHAYFHDEIGIQVMMYAFMIAYNLFQLFLHQCLRNFASSRITSICIADQMNRDYATITDPKDGLFPFDTS